MNFLASIYRQSVNLGLSLVLGLGVAYYFQGWVPARQAEQDARYFRVLKRIGKNMGNRCRVYDERSEALLREAADGLSTSTNIVAALKAFDRNARKVEWLERQRLKQGVLPRLSEFQRVFNAQHDPTPRYMPAAGRVVFTYRSALFDTLQKPNLSNLEPNRREIITAAKKGKAIGRVVPKRNEERSQVMVKTAVTPAEFVDGLEREDVFDDFFVLTAILSRSGQADSLHLCYSSLRGANVLDLKAGPKGKLPTWLVDSTGMTSSRQTKLLLHGQPHRVFIQPVELANAGPERQTIWLLCGAVEEKATTVGQQLPPWFLEGAAVLLLLGGVSLPLLWVLALNRRERLNLRDVVLSGLAVVLGVPLLLLLLLSVMTRNIVAPYVYTDQLNTLAKTINHAVQIETDSLYQRLEAATADPGLNLNPSSPQPNRFAFELVHKSLSDLSSEKKRKDRLQKKNILKGEATDLMQWLGSTGHGLQRRDHIKINKVGEGKLCLPDLTKREYWKRFKTWADTVKVPRQQPASFAWAETVKRHRYIDVINRYTHSGNKSPILTVGGWLRENNKNKKTVRPILATLVTHLRSLENPVLPLGYSFAVINQSDGEVQFHANPKLTLSENLLDDCDADGTVRASLLARDTLRSNVLYQGHRYYLRMAPLAALPERTLVVLADEGAVQNRQLRVLLTSTRLLLEVLVLTLLPFGAVQLFQTKALRLPLRETFPRLWPRAAHRDRYWSIAGLGIAGLGWMLVIGSFVAGLTQVCMLLLLGLWLLATATYILQPLADRHDNIWKETWALLLGYGLLVNVVMGFVIEWDADWHWLLLFQAGLLMGFLAARWYRRGKAAGYNTEPKTPTLLNLFWLILGWSSLNWLLLNWRVPDWYTIGQQQQILFVLFLVAAFFYICFRFAHWHWLARIKSVFGPVSTLLVVWSVVITVAKHNLGLGRWELLLVGLPPILLVILFIRWSITKRSQAEKALPPSAAPTSPHTAFTFMLFVWLLVLGITPAIYCYQVTYGLERELQIRQAHLSVFHQAEKHIWGNGILADSSAEAQNTYPWPFKQYLSFFFYSRVMPADNLHAWPVSAARRVSRSLADTEFRADQLANAEFRADRFNADRQAASVLPTDASQANNWKTHKADLRSRTFLQSQGDSQWLLSEANDAQLGRHWYWPTDLLRYSLNYLNPPKHLDGERELKKIWDELPRWLLRLALLGLVLGGLYWLVWALVRRTFGFEAVGLYRPWHRQRPPILQPLLDRIKGATKQSFYLVCPTAEASGLLDNIKSLRDPKQGNWKIIDCRQPLDETLSEPGKQGGTLLLLHFDYCATDAKMTNAKAVLLALAAANGWRVVAVARAAPDAFADCGHSRDECPDKENHRSIWLAGDRLLDLLAAYEVRHVHVSTRNNESTNAAKNTADAAAVEQQSASALVRLLRAECEPFPFLDAVREELMVNILKEQEEQLQHEGGQQGKDQHALNTDAADDLILRLARRAQLPFRAIWESLSSAQQYVLFDLAQDGLVNALDAPVLSELFHRGLLIAGPQTYALDAPDGLRLVSRSFRLFVLTGVAPDQALRLEREARQAAARPGSWQQRTSGLLLALLLVGGFLLVTQQHVLTQTQTILAAITATLPLLTGLLSGTLFSRTDDKAPKAK